MYYLLIRAYYDKYGTFEQIDNTFFGDRLVGAAKQRGISLQEFCCREVGFPFDNTYSAEDRMMRRAMAVRPEDERFLNMFPGGPVKKSMLKAHNIQPYFTKKSVGFSQEYRDVVETIVNFIEHTDMIALFDKSKNIFTPLHQMFLDLKLAKNEKHLNELIKKYHAPILSILSTAKVIEGIENSYVAAGKIILAHNIVNVEELATNICSHIGRRSMMMPAAHYYFISGNMSYYQLSDPEKSFSYVRFMDLANVYDMTIAQLIQYVGFSFVDQFEIYRHSGYFIYELPGSKYLCVNPFDPGERFDLTYAELRSKYSSEGGLSHA